MSPSKSFPFSGTKPVSTVAENHKPFIYRFYAESPANPFIYRIYANTPGVVGSLATRSAPLCGLPAGASLVVSHYCELFVVAKKYNFFPIKKIRTLSQKNTRGRGGLRSRSSQQPYPTAAAISAFVSSSGFPLQTFPAVSPLLCYYRPKFGFRLGSSFAPFHARHDTTYASRLQTSQRSHSQTNRYHSRWKRHRRARLLRKYQNRRAQPPRRRNYVAIQAFRRAGTRHSQRGNSQRNRGSRRRPDRLRRRYAHLRHRVLGRGHQFLGPRFSESLRNREAGLPDAPGVRQLPLKRNGRSQRPRL